MMKRKNVLLVLTLLGLMPFLSVTAQPPRAPQTFPPGTIIAYAGKTTNIPPGWLVCDGREVEVRRYQALYAVVGTVYGGDGVNRFRLPDLRGRVIVGSGQGEGLSDRPLAQKGGRETVTLEISQLPPHSHGQTNDDDTGAVGGNNQRDGNGGNETTGLDSGRTRKEGGGQPHENMPPFLALNYLIKY
jgi:microcystin-dependent protein